MSYTTDNIDGLVHWQVAAAAGLKSGERLLAALHARHKQQKQVKCSTDNGAHMVMPLQVAAAAGLISGEGLWAVPEAILALAKANPPLCMQFIATSAEKKT